MLPLFPISWLSHLMIVRYAVSGNAQTSPRTLHARFSSSNSTDKISKSIAGSQTYDSFSIRSNNVTAASTKSSDIGSCQQSDLDAKNCALVVGDVDLYFWPDPSRDTSCLSIVGNATNPPMQDASTRTVYGAFYNNSMYTTVYWGCTARDSALGESFITTAVLATTGSMSVKIHLLIRGLRSPVAQKFWALYHQCLTLSRLVDYTSLLMSVATLCRLLQE